MQEKTLLKIALITSLVGILILLIILDKIDVSSSNINAINKTLIDKQVKIKGEITRITETPGLYIINVKDNTGNIDVIIFKEEKLEVSSFKEMEDKCKEDYKSVEGSLPPWNFQERGEVWRKDILIGLSEHNSKRKSLNK